MTKEEFEYYILHHFTRGSKSPDSVLRQLEVINRLATVAHAFDYKLYQSWCIEQEVTYALEHKPMKLFTVYILTVYIRWMNMTAINQWDISIFAAEDKKEPAPFKMVYFSHDIKNWQGIIRAYSFEHAQEQAWAWLREGLLEEQPAQVSNSAVIQRS